MANVDLKTNFKNGDKLYDYELNNNFKAIKAALEAMNKIVWQNDDNASLVMFAGTTEQITNRELIEGQLLYNTQTGETYIDAMVDTELKRISTGGGTSIQIGGIEPTNPATKLWVEDDMLTSLGTEIESGSNENGSYVKFADGTMIQYGEGALDYSDEIDYYSTWTRSAEKIVEFPQQFISTDYVVSAKSKDFITFCVYTIDFKVDQMKLAGITLKNIASTQHTSSYMYTAIGRWK